MELFNRKRTRLLGYDYSSAGAYFITICTKNKKCILSTIVGDAALGVPKNHLSKMGAVVEKYIKSATNMENVNVDKYVIMPTHIHAILCFSAGASPRPTLTDVIGAYKSITTRRCNPFQNTPGQKLFQASFYETVLRNKQAYQECWRYIEENPQKWALEPEDR